METEAPAAEPPAPESTDDTAPAKLPRRSWLSWLWPFGRRRPKPGAAAGSLTQRMIGISALWIGVLLGAGYYTLDRVLTAAVTDNFDIGLQNVLIGLQGSTDVDSTSRRPYLSSLPGDQRFLFAESGLYYQISGAGEIIEASESLWDRRLSTATLPPADQEIHFRDSDEFAPEKLRIAERYTTLPDAQGVWHFQVAQSRQVLDEQIAVLRRTLVQSFAIVALGLMVLAALQAIYGLWPLRRVRRAIIAIRTGEKDRIDERLPREIAPLTDEVNALLAHNEQQAEEARRHAGNLAHALKTPLTVLTNEATAGSPDLAAAVVRETRTMRRQVDHHLARARAVGRRASSQARSEVWPALKAVERAVARLYEDATIDIAGSKTQVARVERQDLDELLGNLIENAAKYGNGRVFVTVGGDDQMVEIEVEDDGNGIPEAQRIAIFDRGARLDTSKPGTGLGLAIVRDVAQIYGGDIVLEESEDLGGLLARLRLPSANALPTPVRGRP